MPRPTKKTCNKCGQPKSLDSFSSNKGGALGKRSSCKQCESTYSHSHYISHRNEVLYRSAENYKQNRDKKLQQTFMRHIRTKYNLNSEDYFAILSQQGCICAVCGRTETTTYRGKTRRLSVDHNHATGEVRGLLCDRCNRGLGIFGDDIKCLKKAITYLERASNAETKNAHSLSEQTRLARSSEALNMA